VLFITNLSGDGVALVVAVTLSAVGGNDFSTSKTILVIGTLFSIEDVSEVLWPF